MITNEQRYYLLSKIESQTGGNGFLPVLSYDDFMAYSFTLSSIAANYCDSDGDLEKIRQFFKDLKNQKGVVSIWFGVVDEDVFKEREQDYLYAENTHIIIEEDYFTTIKSILEGSEERLGFEFIEGFFYGKPDMVTIPEKAHVCSIAWD